MILQYVNPFYDIDTYMRSEGEVSVVMAVEYDYGDPTVELVPTTSYLLQVLLPIMTKLRLTLQTYTMATPHL